MQITRFAPDSLPRSLPEAWRWPRTAGLRLPRLHRYALYIISVLVLAVVLLPAAYLALRVIGGGQESVAYLLKPRTLSIIANSLVLVVTVTASATLIGVAFAWLTTRTDLPARRVVLIAGLLPMVIPSYLAAVTYLAAFGPRGMLYDTLAPVLAPLGVSALPSIYGFFGAWLSVTLCTYPYVVLPVRAALLKADPALEEAARGMGQSRWKTFLRVTLPQLRPALAAGMLLTALYTLSEFGAVSMMRYNVFTRAIDMTYRGSFDRERAAVLALALIVLTLPLLALERQMNARTRNYRVGTGVSRQPRLVRLGHWRGAAVAFCGGLIGLGVIVPVGVMVYWLTTRAPVETLPVDFTALTAGTVGISLVAALVIGLAALPIGTLAARHANGLTRAFASLSYIGNALPGIVVGLALVFFAANHLPTLYQTLPLLVTGYAVRFLPYGVGATRSALTQVNPATEEAARSLGCRPWQVTLRVTLPLVRTGLLGGVALAFLSVMKELPTTLMLAPPGFRTLASRIWSAHTDALYALIAQPGLMLMAVSAVALAVILWREER